MFRDVSRQIQKAVVGLIVVCVAVLGADWGLRDTSILPNICFIQPRLAAQSRLQRKRSILIITPDT